MSTIKQIRGQIRQIVKDLLPEVLATEVGNALHKSLTAQLQKRMDEITNHMKRTLDTIDERSKDIQSYVVRNSPAEAPKITKSE